MNVLTEDNIINVVHLLTNFKYLAASYNQFWKYDIVHIEADDEGYLAAIDERSGEVKLLFTNPDEKMHQFIDMVKERGWLEIKKEYLIDQAEAMLEPIKNGQMVHDGFYCKHNNNSCEQCNNCYCPCHKN